MRERLRMDCDDKQICLHIQGNEQVSMLITGRSRMGKTYFASCLGCELIGQGVGVHLIDLGNKWSTADKERLLSAGAVMRRVEKEGIILTFSSITEASGCGRIIANALGFRSAKANMLLKRSIRRIFALNGQRVTFDDLLEYLESSDEDHSEDHEWQLKVWEQLDSCGEMPNIIFLLDENNDFSKDSVI